MLVRSKRLRCVLLVALLPAGCARLAATNHGPSADAASDGPIRDATVIADQRSEAPALDVSAADTLSTVTCDWSKGLTVGTPVALTSLNGPGLEQDPFLTADGLTLYFNSYSGTPGLYLVTRSGRDRPFDGEPQAVPSTLIDGQPAAAAQHLMFTPDQQLAVVHASWDDPSQTDIWIGERVTATGPLRFGNWQRVLQLSSPLADWDPHLSPDGLTLYSQSKVNTGMVLKVATRTARSAPFAGVAVLELGTPDAQSPSLTADQRTLVFANCGLANCAIYYATRASAQGSFGTPQPVPNIETSADEVDPFVSADGCELFFARILPNTGWDLYHARISPP